MPYYLLHEWGNDGKMLSGGYLYFYESGTFTPKTVYQDAELTIPLSNPVQLSAQGTAVIFMGDGAYRVWIKDAVGQQIAPWVDGISGSGGGGTGSAGSNGSFAIVKTYNDLRAFLTVPDAIYVCGRNTDGDGGEGWFELITASTMTDDDGVILCSGAGSNVYRRVFTASIDPRWYGVTYNTSIDNTTYLNNAFNKSLIHNYPVQIAGSVFIAQNITVASHVSVIFDDDGYLTANTPVSITFADQSKMQGYGRCFGTNVSPHFGLLVADIIKLSWMGGAVSDDILTKLINAPGAYNTPILIDYPITTTLTSIVTASEVHFLPAGNITFNTGTNALTISVPNIVDSGYPMLIIPNNAAITLLDFGNQYAKPDWFSVSGQDRAIYYALRTGKCKLKQGKAYNATTAFGALPNVLEIIGEGTLNLVAATAITTQTLTVRDIAVAAANTFNWASASVLLRAYNALIPSTYSAASKVIDGCVYTDDALNRAPVYDGKPGIYNAHLPLIPNADMLRTDSAGKIYGAYNTLELNTNWNLQMIDVTGWAASVRGFFSDANIVGYTCNGHGYASRSKSDVNASWVWNPLTLPVAFSANWYLTYIAYSNGKYYAFTRCFDSSFNNRLEIFVATSLSGTWTAYPGGFSIPYNSSQYVDNGWLNVQVGSVSGKIYASLGYSNVAPGGMVIVLDGTNWDQLNSASNYFMKLHLVDEANDYLYYQDYYVTSSTTYIPGSLYRCKISTKANQGSAYSVLLSGFALLDSGSTAFAGKHRNGGGGAAIIYGLKDTTFAPTIVTQVNQTMGQILTLCASTNIIYGGSEDGRIGIVPRGIGAGTSNIKVMSRRLSGLEGATIGGNAYGITASYYVADTKEMLLGGGSNSVFSAKP